MSFITNDLPVIESPAVNEFGCGEKLWRRGHEACSGGRVRSLRWQGRGPQRLEGSAKGFPLEGAINTAKKKEEAEEKTLLWNRAE